MSADKKSRHKGGRKKKNVYINYAYYSRKKGECQ